MLKAIVCHQDGLDLRLPNNNHARSAFVRENLGLQEIMKQ